MVEAQLFGIVPVVGATPGDLASFTSAGLLADSGVSSAIAHDPATLHVTANGNDATAARGRSDLAFATLNAAASAAVSGDTIRIGIGTFAPLTASLPAWVRVVGSGRPHVDSVTAPTTLVGGTVIQGPLSGTADGFELWHAGVDCGSAVCSALYGGTAHDALAVSNVPGSHPTGLPQIKGVRIADVVCLAQSPTALVHACRLENVVGMTVNGIETWFGVHGMAVKAVDSNIVNHLASGHGSSGLYLKSDNYAPCANTNASNIVVRSIGSSSTAQSAIIISGFSGAMSNITVSNFNVGPSIQHGLQIDGTYSLQNVTVSNGIINGCGSDGVSFTTTTCDMVTLNNVQSVNCSGNGFTVRGSATRTSLTGCLAFNNTADGFSLDNGSDANHVLTLTGCAAFQNGGNGFNNLGSSAFTFGVNLVAQANSTAAFAGNNISLPSFVLQGPFGSQVPGVGGGWGVGQGQGAGSNNDTFGIYSGTFGPSHGYFPIMQLGSDGSATFCKGGGAFVLPALPTSDPHVAGQCWSNSGVVTVSAG
jgi:hypothetical protein